MFGHIYAEEENVMVTRLSQNYLPNNIYPNMLVDPPHQGPVIWNIDVPFGVSLNKLLNKHYMSRWFDMYWSLFDVAVMIYNKIWMNTSHELYINPWLVINFSRLYQKKK